jgi:hypothetical protein
VKRLTGLSGLSSRIGAEPALSALSLRLVLAVFGFVVCLVGAVIAFVLGVVAFGVVLLVLAVLGLIDAVVVIVRRRHGTAPII